MLPARARVRTPAEHRQVGRRGLRASAGPLSVSLLPPLAAPAHVPAAAAARAVPAPPGPSVAPGAPAGHSRAGVVVPKAVGTAVARNRVARQLRHLLRDRLAALPPGTAVVVRAAPGAHPQSSAALADALDRALAAAQHRAARRAGRPA